MRIVFMGTPEFAIPSLQALIENGHEIAGVFCQPDKPKGRGNKLTMCPVKEFALAHGIPVFQPRRIRLDGAQDLAGLKPDLCVTAAFGQILSVDNLSVPKLGTVNVHASLLPQYRGSAPINWAIIKGETVTGVTTMLTDKGMDTGDILLQKRFEIEPDISAGELTEKLSVLGAELLIQTLKKIENGDCPREKQDESKMSYFPMLKKEMGQIDFSKPAKEICDLVRGINPWPGAYAYCGDELIKIWKASVQKCGNDHVGGEIISADARTGLLVRAGQDAVLIEEMQLPGGKRMLSRDYLRGHTMKENRFTRHEDAQET